MPGNNYEVGDFEAILKDEDRYGFWQARILKKTTSSEFNINWLEREENDENLFYVVYSDKVSAQSILTTEKLEHEDHKYRLLPDQRSTIKELVGRSVEATDRAKEAPTATSALKDRSDQKFFPENISMATHREAVDLENVSLPDSELIFNDHEGVMTLGTSPTANEITGNAIQDYEFEHDVRDYSQKRENSASSTEDRKTTVVLLESSEANSEAVIPKNKFQEADKCNQPDVALVLDKNIPKDPPGNNVFFSIIKLKRWDMKPRNPRNHSLNSKFLKTCHEPEKTKRVLESDTTKGDYSCWIVFFCNYPV